MEEPHACPGNADLLPGGLYLDGILGHAWTPEIVERIVGRRCALQCINMDLVQSLDTRHIDLWAWMADPSTIPKKVWLVFTHRLFDCSTIGAVLHEQPDQWQQGVQYAVFVHLGVVEDYTEAAQDIHGVVSNPTVFKPIKRGYAWRYGLVDGSPVGSRATFLARLPLPPRNLVDRDEERCNTGTHRDCTLHGHEHAGHARDGEARRNMARSCKDEGFVWPGRTNSDDDDDDMDDGSYYHPGTADIHAIGLGALSRATSTPRDVSARSHHDSATRNSRGVV